VPRHAQAARLRQTLAQAQTFAISRRMLPRYAKTMPHKKVIRRIGTRVEVACTGVTVSRARQADAVNCRALDGTIGGCTNIGVLWAGLWLGQPGFA
jgi:hypothetical protein